MYEWKEIQLGEVIEFKNGFAFKSTDFVANGIPVIKIKNVKPNNILLDTLSYVSETVAKGKDSYLIQPDDILITMSGNRSDGSPDSWVGKVALFKKKGKYLLNQRVSIIRVSKNKASIPFVAYILTSWQSQVYLINQANSSGGQANISPDTVKEMEILLPPLSEQIQIASILNSLDDKIDLLYRQNKTLEQLAETLFRQWFVEEAEESWMSGKLSDLINVKYGKDHKDLAEGNIPAFGSGGLMRRVEKPLYDLESVLIPRKGTLSNVMYIDEPFWTVDTMFYTEMKKQNIAKFIYHFVKEQDLASMNVGSAVPSMTTEILNNFILNIPDDGFFIKFEKGVSNLYKKLKANNEQITTLTKIRDTLLPKLMSGEIRVK